MDASVRKMLRQYFAPHVSAAIGIAMLILIAQLSALVEPIILRRVVDSVLPGRDKRMLVVLAGVAIIARIGAALIERLQQRWSTRRSASIFRVFIVEFFDHIQRLDLAFFSDTKMGEFMQRLGQDLYHTYRLVFAGITGLASSFMVIIVLLTYGFFLNPILGAHSLVTIPIYVVAQRYAGKRIRASTEDMVQTWSEVASFQSEKISGVRLVQELAAEDAIRAEYDSLNANAARSFAANELAGHLGQVLTNLTVYAGPMLIIAVGGHLYFAGSVSLGSLLAFFDI